MNYNFTRKILMTGLCAGLLLSSAEAQYRKMNFATTYVSGSGGISDGTDALGFNPTSGGAFTQGYASFSGTVFNSYTASGTYQFDTNGSAGDTIYLKINTGITLSDITIQPLNGTVNAGSSGSPVSYTLPSVNNTALSDGQLVIFKAASAFNALRITYQEPSLFGNSLNLYEIFFKSPGTAWPQDCDRPFESTTLTTGLTLGTFSNPYDIMDNGTDYLSTYSSMAYTIGAVATTFTQEVYFPSPGSTTDEVRLQVGNPTSLISALLSYGATLGNSVTVQPYLNNTSVGAEQSLNYYISLQLGVGTTIADLISGNNIRPIYFKPGVQFNKIVIRWNVPAGLGTLNQFAFYDIRRVPEAPKVQSVDSIAVCQNTTGIQLSASSSTGEPNLTYHWYANNPNGSVDSASIGTGTSFTVPASYTATAGRKVFYVAAIRTICDEVMSDADSVIVQVYAAPKFTNAPLPDGNVKTSYTTSVITTDSAATYTVSGLPDGLSFDASSATISGSPTTEGQYNVVVTATPTAGPGCPTIVTYPVKVLAQAGTPVTITDFTGTLNKSVAHLSWKSGVEENFSYFVVQKSTDAKTYSDLEGSKTAAKGNGSIYNYDATQTEPVAYYRLLAVDNDGSQNVKDKIVKLSQNVIDISIYPNPAQDNLYITAPNAGTVFLYDAAGHKVLTQIVLEGQNIINVKMLSTGTYFGKLNNATFKFIKK